jgi:carbamoyltransferase
MNILGISDNHASGASLVQDQNLTWALSQERLDREKNSGAFPDDAIDAVLDASNLTPKEIDRLALGSEITPSFFLRLMRPFHHKVRASAGNFSLLYNGYIVYQVVARFGLPPIYWLDRWACKKLVERHMRAKGFACPVSMVDHHDAHAYSTFLTGPFENATVITADAMGDAVSVTVGIGKPDGTIERVYTQSGFTAINPYYSRTTEYLGFTPVRHEGKVTGLAAYGDPEPLLPAYNANLHFVGPGFSFLNFFTKHDKRWGLYKKLEGHSRENIAAALQTNLENEMVKFVRYWLERTKVPNVCLAGGIFENVKLNQRIHEMDEVEGVYIFPAMSDGGLSAGAALKVAGAKPSKLKSAYLGPGFSEGEMERALTEAGLPCRRVEDVAEEVSTLLAAGEVVARYDGRIEFGPRALGHRSILTQASDPKVNDWLNEMLGRSEFMPFAPAVIAEDAESCFLGYKGAEFTSKFMNVCFDCTEELKKGSPGVVHVDGTARPQVVSREDDETYYEIIRRYGEKTGLKAIINTSYNMHEEPIVYTPSDAVRAFIQGRLSHLSMGPFMAGRIK